MPETEIADRLTAELAAIREREQAATTGPWQLETDRDEEYGEEFPYAIIMPVSHTERPAGVPFREWDFRYSAMAEMTMATAEFLVEARTAVPRLLAAVEAVLAIHRPGFEMCVDALWCQHCGVQSDWPCPTVQAITRALTGADGTS